MDDQKTQTPAPDNEATSTLYRFCLSHGLALSPQERCAEGVALSKVAREQEIPLIRAPERIEHLWIKSRLYPVSFLNEWLVRYREAQARADAAVDCSAEPQQAANA